MSAMHAVTSFEVEAERRREVLAASMRDVRRSRRTIDGPSRETERSIEASEGGGLAAAVSLLSRVRQRARLANLVRPSRPSHLP